nr:reverse transcriptase domain-containing protein [Tanacetum cinerariifolium]
LPVQPRSENDPERLVATPELLAKIAKVDMGVFWGVKLSWTLASEVEDNEQYEVLFIGGKQFLKPLANFTLLVFQPVGVVFGGQTVGSVRRSNRRRVPNIVEPEIRTIEEIVSMTDRIMKELLQAPTEGYEEAIVIPEILAKIFKIKTNLLQRSNRRRVPNIVEPEIRTIEEIVLMADRTVEEQLQAPTEGYGEAIVILEILAENFEIKTNLLQLVQSNKFHGSGVTFHFL